MFASTEDKCVEYFDCEVDSTRAVSDLLEFPVENTDDGLQWFAILRFPPNEDGPEDDVIECLGLIFGGVTVPPPIYLGLADRALDELDVLEIAKLFPTLHLGETEPNFVELPDNNFGDVDNPLFTPNAVVVVLNICWIFPAYFGDMP